MGRQSRLRRDTWAKNHQVFFPPQIQPSPKRSGKIVASARAKSITNMQKRKNAPKPARS